MREIEGFDGILFIGDVHASSKAPGRRIDNYAAAVLDKLVQCAAICHEQRLYPVCLGDLFHRARENSLELLAGMMAVLRTFPAPMLVLGGSHDRTESWFTSKDAAKLLADAGVIELIDEPGLVKALRINGERVAIWGTPAGYPVPDSVTTNPEGTNLMVTHHDFDFNGLYPGAEELHEIEHCSLLVNGHMHTPCNMVLRGGTACHNPGSLLRVSVDLRKMTPAVSVWTPAHGLSLQRVPLKVAEDVFDLTGKEVYAADPRTLKAALPKGLRLSSFAAKLRATEELEAGRTDDGSVLVEELEAYLTRFDKPDNLKRYLTGLLAEVVAERT